jgi:hypothetical protein
MFEYRLSIDPSVSEKIYSEDDLKPIIHDFLSVAFHQNHVEPSTVSDTTVVIRKLKTEMVSEFLHIVIYVSFSVNQLWYTARRGDVVLQKNQICLEEICY